VTFLCLSGFRNDAAVKNCFNPPRDFSQCCKTQDKVTFMSAGQEMLCSSTAPVQMQVRPPCNEEEEEGEQRLCPSQG